MAEILEKKFLGTEGVERLVENIRTEINEGDQKALQDAKDYADGLADNYDAAGTAETKVNELANGQVKTNKEAIEKLNGGAEVEGSVDNKIAAAKSTIDESIAAVEKKADDAQADADAIGADLGDVDGLSTTNKTVVGAINEVLAAVGTGGTAAVVTVTTDTTSDGALKSYTIKQGTTTVGVIDIPKDMVVESGSVVNLADGEVEGYAAGTYIKLVLANVTEPLYINVANLVDIYKAKANATQVQITIDPASREVSAAIVAGSITSTELATDSVTTAKIANSNVTKEKLSTSVQASLDKADAAAPQASLDAEVTRAKGAEAQALADAKSYADTEIGKEKTRAEGVEAGLDQRLQSVEGKLGTGEGSVDSKIATAKQEAIDAAAGDATTKANTAESNAKGYTDAEIAKTNGDVDAIEASLAEGGATANAIADAKKAGTDAQGLVSTLENGKVADLRTDVDALKSVNYVEITTAEIDAMFA